ncbi:hypothetical protein E2C01_062014 [Portunus trituberculatus]|uniref:Uncharacterized protein n=1 Tax=Portunus trituberculatus TaxID=210409 RepID=A0A5B7HFX4_PORTR|nr:hypothetical protein [Portunus trituberculatus]
MPTPTSLCMKEAAVERAVRGRSRPAYIPRLYRHTHFFLSHVAVRVRKMVAVVAVKVEVEVVVEGAWENGDNSLRG